MNTSELNETNDESGSQRNNEIAYRLSIAVQIPGSSPTSPQGCLLKCRVVSIWDSDSQ